MPTVDEAAGAAEPADVPAWIIPLLEKYRWIPEALLLLSILIVIELVLRLPIALALALAAGFGAAVIYVYRRLQRWQAAGQAGETIGEAGQTPAAVDRLPDSPDFALADPGSSFRPSTGAPTARPRRASRTRCATRSRCSTRARRSRPSSSRARSTFPP